MADTNITLSWTETREVKGVAVPLSRLVELMTEHAPDDLKEAIGNVLAEKGRTEIDQYAPIFRALTELAQEQECDIIYTDFDSIEHDA